MVRVIPEWVSPFRGSVIRSPLKGNRGYAACSDATAVRAKLSISSTTRTC